MNDLVKNPEINIISLDGIFPVQAEGTINGQTFYFRARGRWWSVEILSGDRLWTHSEEYGAGAGDMDQDEAKKLIGKAARLFHEAIDQSPAAN